MRFWEGFFIGYMVGVVLFALLAYSSLNDDLSSNTQLDICKNLSPNQTIVDAKISDGKLICITPTYDHTSNIIFQGSDKP